MQLINLPKTQNLRGNFMFTERGNHISFEIKRTYWIYDVSGESNPG